MIYFYKLIPSVRLLLNILIFSLSNIGFSSALIGDHILLFFKRIKIKIFSELIKCLGKFHCEKRKKIW